jgi:hypothetical protein
MKRSGKVLAAGVLVACGLIAARGTWAAPQSGASAGADADNAFIDAMTGDWSMNGPTLGKPTRYALHGERVLAAGWVRLQMRDKAKPPQYQADFFLGYDKNKHDYIGHWLDQFGAAGARVVAEGHRDGNTLVLLFPYADGAFRNTFTYDPDKRLWTWLLESQEKDGKWSTFAKYDVTKT